MNRLAFFLALALFVSITTVVAPLPDVIAGKSQRKPPKYVKKYSKGKQGKLTKEQKERKKARDKKAKKTSMTNLMKLEQKSKTPKKN